MVSTNNILDVIQKLQGSGKTFAEFLAEAFKDKFLEIYVGDAYEDVSIDQISVTYPSVFCGKVVGAYRECLLINCVHVNDDKQLVLGNIVFINERAIRALTEVNTNGVIEDMMLRSRETLEVAKHFGKKK
jgi:hypothetical protein